MKQLREEYKRLYGKGPFNGWNAEKLQEKINAKHDEDPEAQTSNKFYTQEELEEKDRMAEAKRINSMNHRTIEEQLIPVFIGGVPHGLVKGQYVPFEEAERYNQKLIVDREQKKLDDMEKLSIEKAAKINNTGAFANERTAKLIEQNLI